MKEGDGWNDFTLQAHPISMPVSIYLRFYSNLYMIIWESEGLEQYLMKLYEEKKVNVRSCQN